MSERSPSHPIPPSPPGWLEKIYWLLFACLPWSFETAWGSWRLDTPTEPLIAAAGLGLFWYWIPRLREFWRRVSGNYLLLFSFGWIAWLFVCVCTSDMPLVSAKYWIVEAGHWWVFAAGLSLCPPLIPICLSLFLTSMTGVALYTFLHHATYGFKANQAILGPTPFYSDHTIYGAVLVTALFAGYASLKSARSFPATWILRHPWILRSAIALLLTTLALTGSRAALFTFLLGALLYSLFLTGKLKWLVVIAVLLPALGSLPYIREKISAKIETDVSIRERINRWDCAASMVGDRPWTGFGPGTYPFAYIPYQRPENRTRISLSAPLSHRGPDTFGRGGSAHSEYWQAASETGWPGFVVWVCLSLSLLFKGWRRAMTTGEAVHFLWWLGLMAFFLHALVNNFLHDPRMAALVWSGLAWTSRNRG